MSTADGSVYVQEHGLRMSVNLEFWLGLEHKISHQKHLAFYLISQGHMAGCCEDGS
jgi:hypothetical protein